MAVPRTTNGFDKASQAEFMLMYDTITSSMNNNPSFPEQKSLVDELLADRPVYGDLVQAAVKGGTQAILLRDEKRNTIVIKLRNLGNQVTAVCQGNTAMLESSGFDYTGDKRPSPPMVTPPPPKVSLGEGKGQLLCKAQKQGNNAVNYLICADTPGATWQSFSSTKSTYLFTNLQSGQNYMMKYELVGPRDQVVTSDIMTYIPQ
jgi:hypothetical protein